MSNPVTVYHLDKELKVIEVYSSYKEASQKTGKSLTAIRDQTYRWRSRFLNNNLQLVREEDYKALLLERIAIIRMEIRQKKNELGRFKNEFRKYFK